MSRAWNNPTCGTGRYRQWLSAAVLAVLAASRPVAVGAAEPGTPVGEPADARAISSDLPDILSTGRLRVVSVPGPGRPCPASSPERRMLEAFAASVHLDAVHVCAVDADRALASVRDGHADVAASHPVSSIAAVPGLSHSIALAGAHTEPDPGSEESPPQAGGPVAWAVRADNPVLRESLDRFLMVKHAAFGAPAVRHRDLAEIKASGILRVLAEPDRAQLYLRDGDVRGFEYELITHFARVHRLEVEVVTPPEGESPLEWLRQGRGDVVITPLSFAEGEGAGVRPTVPYRRLQHYLVAREGAALPPTAASISEASLALAQDSPRARIVSELWSMDLAPRPVVLPEDTTLAETLDGVASGTFDYAVVLAPQPGRELVRRRKLTLLLPLGEERPEHWAVREDATDLAGALDGFISKEYRGELYNVLARKYARAYERRSPRSAPADTLSPYDDLVQRFARRYAFDWRLISAQMYQESRFDPEAESSKGAQGLLQVMPTTAPEVGFDALTTPEDAIHAGVKYLARLRDRFERALPVSERTWFALAAYNAGYGRVRDARRLAVELGLDPDRWFGHVERAITELPSWSGAGSNLHRHCRCWQPVRYVRAIRSRYAAYLTLTGTLASKDAPDAGPPSRGRAVADRQKQPTARPGASPPA